jgi:hypothetical protein
LVVHRQPQGSEYAYLIDEIHIVPLSDNIVYNDNIEYPTLNYSHLDNIRHLYNIIGDDMFNNFSVFNNSRRWLYNSKKYPVDSYDHTYELGMKRIRHSRYGKQFSYLTPMWITDNIDDLWFKFMIHDGVECALPYPHTNHNHHHHDFINAGYGVHMTDAVKKYILDYISNADDQVMSMKFGTYEAWIDGVHAPSGTLMHKDIEYTLTTILSREYTMMEFDYILDSAWLTNKMVAKQLLNFNIVFDIEDILPPEYNEYIYNDLFNVDVDIMYSRDGEVLTAEYKDIYSNYEKIPGFVALYNGHIAGGYDDKTNVLDYIQDYDVKDMLYMNKITQPITHWALNENPEYTFNMYNGFSPYRQSSNERGAGMFYNQPDMTLDKYTPISCNILWANIVDYRYSDIGTALALDYEESSPIDITHDIVWHHNIKYNTSNLVNPGFNEFKVDIILVQSIEYVNFEEYDYVDLLQDHCVIVVKEDDDGIKHFIIMADNEGLDCVTFSSLSNTNAIELSNNDDFKFLQSFIRCAEKPYAVTLNSTYELAIAEAPRHIPPTSETDLYIVNEPVTLYRYSGNLMPQFIDPLVEDIPHINRVYHYVQWWKDEDGSIHTDGSTTLTEYNDMLNTRYPAEYPSIGYYALIGDNIDVNTVPDLYKTYDAVEQMYEYWDEFVWFKRSRVKVLKPKVVIRYTVDDASECSEAELDNMFWKELYRYVWPDDVSEDVYIDARRMDILQENYNMTMTFEYTKLNKLNSIDYTLTFELK